MGKQGEPSRLVRRCLKLTKNYYIAQILLTDTLAHPRISHRLLDPSLKPLHVYAPARPGVMRQLLIGRERRPFLSPLVKGSGDVATNAHKRFR